MEFLLAVVLVVVMGKVLSELFERLGLVSLLGSLGAGIVLGVSVLGTVQAHAIEQFATMGVILLLFLAGYEETNTDFMIDKRSWLLSVASIGLVATLVLLFLFGNRFLGLDSMGAAVFAFAFAVTDVAVGAKALLSTGKTGTDTGKSLLGLAVVDTILGIVLLAIGVTVMQAGSWYAVQRTAGGIFLFFGITVVAGRYLPWLVEYAEEMEVEAGKFALALTTVFLLAYLAERLELAAVLGAYFGGIILQRSETLNTHGFNETMKNMAYGFFVPLFFGWMGLKIDLGLVPTYWKTALLVAAVALAGKFVIVSLVSYVAGAGGRESMIYGLGLIPKGADNLIVLAIGESVGVLSGQLYEMVLVSLTLVIIISILLSTVGLKVFLKK